VILGSTTIQLPRLSVGLATPWPRGPAVLRLHQGQHQAVAPQELDLLPGRVEGCEKCVTFIGEYNSLDYGLLAKERRRARRPLVHQRLFKPNLLFTRQPPAVHGGLACAVLAGHLGWAVRWVPSYRVA
jgi:hypothetical protein